ncbi:MAG: MltA domain-containing protein, partial [Gammaproteobacteria bacterium]
MKNWTKLFILASSFVVMILSGISYYTGMFGAHFFLLEARFENLPGWKQDNQAEALKAFLRSCYAIEKLKPKATFGSLPRGGDAAAWQTICQAAHKLTVADSDTARKFFEYWFQPYRIENNFNPKGIFTGYYLPLVHASLKKDKHFTVPIYALPNDLVKINLGSFHPELLGKTIVGKLENNLLKTYPDRSAIMAGALQNKARILAWSDNPVDLFFAQI